MLLKILSRRKSGSVIILGPNHSLNRKTVREGACFILGDTRPNRLVHPDYTELDAFKDKSIDKVREWASKADAKPFEGGSSVLALLAVDSIEEAAANAILKLVEEPPPKTFILLSAVNQARVIPTILSRCFRIVVPCSTEDVEDRELKEGHRFYRAVIEGHPNRIVEFTEVESLVVLLEVATLFAKDSFELGGFLSHLEMAKQYVRSPAIIYSLARYFDESGGIKKSA